MDRLTRDPAPPCDALAAGLLLVGYGALEESA